MGSIIQNKSHFETAEYIQPDAIFQITKRYLQDQDPRKVNVGAGTYRDENGDPWILPSVRMATKAIEGCGHEYLPIAGSTKFRERAVKLVFHGSKALAEDRVSHVFMS